MLKDIMVICRNE